MIDIEDYERRLTERRAELERRLSRIEEDLERTPDPDAEERATERENDEVLEKLGSGAVKELRAIDAALSRMRLGRFGRCISCAGEIDPRRLDALPYTLLCRDCAN